MKRLQLSQSRTTQKLHECRSHERIAALPMPLHIQQTDCNALHCSKHQSQMRNNCPRMRQLSQGKEHLEFLSKCRPEAHLAATYLILCRGPTNMYLREYELPTVV